MNSVAMQTPQGMQFLFHVVAGVLQGCPASGLLFAWSVDVFVRLLAEAFDMDRPGAARGCCRACADDIGLVIGKLQSLDAAFPICADAARLANLVLKPPKCNIIPLCPIQ